MTDEERIERLARIDAELVDRQRWRRRFPSGDQEAALAIAELMDQAGTISMNPETVKPELVASLNFILFKLGVNHPHNLVNVAAALLKAANDEDLLSERARLSKEEDHAD